MAVTRLSLAGVPGAAYLEFLPKTEADIPLVPDQAPAQPTGGWWWPEGKPEPQYTEPRKKRRKRKEEPEFTDPTAAVVPLSDAIVIEERAIPESDVGAYLKARANYNVGSAKAAAQEKDDEEAIVLLLSIL